MSVAPSRRTRTRSSRAGFRATGVPSVARLERRRGRRGRPCSASNAGRTKSSKQTSVETGLPGSPKTSVRPRTPNKSGFPGRIATRQNTSLDAELLADGADEIVGADRDAAGADHDVVLEAVPERRAVCVLVVGDRDPDDLPPADDERGEHRAVGVVDLARLEPLSRPAQLVADGQDRHRGSRAQGNVARPTAAAAPTRAAPRRVPVRSRRLPVADSRRRRPYVRARRDAGRERADAVQVRRDDLDRSHRVGARRDHAAGRDRHASPAPRGRVAAGPRRFTHDGQAAGRVRRPQRVAVHRGVVERRQVDRGARRFGEHAARRVADVDLLARQRPHPFEDAAQSLLDREQVGHAQLWRRPESAAATPSPTRMVPEA